MTLGWLWALLNSLLSTLNRLEYSGALDFGAQWSKRPGPGQLCLGHTVPMGKNEPP